MPAPIGRHPLKVAVIGFTQHRALAPYGDPEWEKWGINDLYLDLPIVKPVDCLRWFQLHAWEDVVHHKQEAVTVDPLQFAGGPPHPRDANHVAWLALNAKTIPVYLMAPREEVPDALVYPREAVYDYFGVRYFTNSISWMIALAIMEMVPEKGGRALPGSELGVWGVDMMMAGGAGSEYGYQRPSCEWLLGYAMAAGIKVQVPQESDLLKTAFQYGDHTSNPFRVKLGDHKAELLRRRAGAIQQKQAHSHGEAELNGALHIIEWIEHSWMPGDEGDAGPGTAPLPGAHKQTPMLGTGAVTPPEPD